jgi:hypothetical protein
MRISTIISDIIQIINRKHSDLQGLDADDHTQYDRVDGTRHYIKNLLTTQGDLLIRGATGLERLPIGSAGQVLKSQGAGANPVWGDVPSESFETSLIAGEKLFAGEPVYLGSDGKIYACDSARSTKIGFIGFVKSNVDEGQNATIIFQGLADLFSGLNILSDYYLQDFTYTQDLATPTGLGGDVPLSLNPWQSFTAVGSYFNRVGLYFLASNTASYSFTLFVYSGEGTGGTLLHSESCSVSLTTDYAWYYFNLSKRISLVSGSKYTIQLSGSSSHYWKAVSNDPYPYGRSGYRADYDHLIQIFHDNGAQIGTTPGTNSVKVGKAWTSTKIKI